MTDNLTTPLQILKQYWKYPAFRPLQEDIIESVLNKMGDVDKILIAGDYAKGIDSGNIEVIIVGNEINYQYLTQLEEKIENLISRRVSFFLTARPPVQKNLITIYTKQ